MMEQVLVLITVESSMEKQVLDSITKIRNIIESHFLYGPYDIYAKAEARTTEELEHLIMDDLRKIKGITSTTTCFFADAR